VELQNCKNKHIKLLPCKYCVCSVICASKHKNTSLIHLYNQCSIINNYIQEAKLSEKYERIHDFIKWFRKT